MHEIPLISTIAVALALALILGFIAVRLKIPTIVGYLIAGIIIGPYTPGIIANVELAQELAEIGVMLLMFGVGLHFSLSDLFEVRNIALPGALVQIAVATFLGASSAIYWGWNPGAALIFGLALSVASTVVLLRALEQRNALDTVDGHIAIGWLIVEDIAMIIALVLLPPISNWLEGSLAVNGGGSFWPVLGFTLLKFFAFVILMLVVGPRILPRLLWQVSRTGSRELFILFVIAAAVSIAYGAAKFFGVSFALGAFFAGMIMRESSLSRRAAEESLPLRDAFAVLFFVSVGMLFNPYVLFDEPLKILIVIAIIIFGKSLAAFFLVLAFRYPISTALVVSASLAQIGEFSFILTELGIKLKVLPIEGRSFVLAGALISIALNPLVFHAIRPMQSFLSRYFNKKPVSNKSIDDPLSILPAKFDKIFKKKHIVIIGFGKVGRRIIDLLTDKKINFVIIDNNREKVERLRNRNIPAIWGDAEDEDILAKANTAKAGLLLIVISESINVRRIVKNAVKLNPDIETIIRTHSNEEAYHLQQEINGKVFFAEDEIAKNIGEYLLEKIKPQRVKKTKTS